MLILEYVDMCAFLLILYMDAKHGIGENEGCLRISIRDECMELVLRSFGAAPRCIPVPDQLAFRKPLERSCQSSQ